MKKETKRVTLGVAGVIVCMLIAWTMNRDLFQGDLKIQTTQPAVKVAYAPLEPTFASDGTLIAQPSFSKGSMMPLLITTGLTCCFLVLIGVGFISYTNLTRKEHERQELKQNKE